MTDQLAHVGGLVRGARSNRGWTEAQLASAVGVPTSTIQEVERGYGATPDVLARISDALERAVPVGEHAPPHLRITGGRTLSGEVDVRTSKNASVALMCASLLTSGRTVLRKVARIEEVHRMVDVLSSIGLQIRWIDNDLELVRHGELTLENLDVAAARRTRSVLLLLAPLIHHRTSFDLPYAGGCELGTRTVEPHLNALRSFGVEVQTTDGCYSVSLVSGASREPARPIVLIERGDTVTENALMAAARTNGVTVIKNASSNYMVQDLCFFIEKLGVEIDGIGTTTLTVRGVPEITCDIDFAPSEDPIEAMSLLTAGIVTNSDIVIRRSPIDFLEVELAVLEHMGLKYDRSGEYLADNGRTKLVDLSIQASELRSSFDKVHPMPFPGLNIDNLPFFAAIAACSVGSTLVHDWVYENRAIYLTELSRLGARVELYDPHRVRIDGPTRWKAAEVVCPPALRPAVVLLLAMLAAEGTSVLRSVYVISRGYEDLAERLNYLGASIETFRDA